MKTLSIDGEQHFEERKSTFKESAVGTLETTIEYAGKAVTSLSKGTGRFTSLVVTGFKRGYYGDKAPF